MAPSDGAEPTPCPGCSAPVLPGAYRCRRCGFLLTHATKAPSAPAPSTPLRSVPLESLHYARLANFGGWAMLLAIAIWWACILGWIPIGMNWKTGEVGRASSRIGIGGLICGILSFVVPVVLFGFASYQWMGFRTECREAGSAPPEYGMKVPWTAGLGMALSLLLFAGSAFWFLLLLATSVRH